MAFTGPDPHPGLWVIHELGLWIQARSPLLVDTEWVCDSIFLVRRQAGKSAGALRKESSLLINRQQEILPFFPLHVMACEALRVGRKTNGEEDPGHACSDSGPFVL